MDETSDKTTNPHDKRAVASRGGQKSANFKPVKVGFDLDGVLFFNPLRIVRRPIEIFKKYILRKETMSFYIPQTKAEKIMWKIVHMSSLKPAKGWEKIRELTEKGLIEPYLITARFECLKNDFHRCKSKIKAEEYFTATYHNALDEQPHLFKEKMVRDLGIEYFVEDNWNIVDHLSKSTKTKVLWITNIADQDIQFGERFPSLEKAVERLADIVKK